jgi:hypothetical protein
VYVRLATGSDAPAEPPRSPHWGAPGWGHIRLQNRFDADVTACVENFIDVPHTVFVHPVIFRTARGQASDRRSFIGSAVRRSSICVGAIRRQRPVCRDGSGNVDVRGAGRGVLCSALACLEPFAERALRRTERVAHLAFLGQGAVKRLAGIGHEATDIGKRRGDHFLLGGRRFFRGTVLLVWGGHAASWAAR